MQDDLENNNQSTSLEPIKSVEETNESEQNHYFNAVPQEPQAEPVQGYYVNTNNSQPEKTTGGEIASLIIGILSMLCCAYVPIVGTVLPIIGIILACSSRKHHNGSFSGIAIAGLAISIIGLLTSLATLAMYIFVILIGILAGGDVEYEYTKDIYEIITIIAHSFK